MMDSMEEQLSAAVSRGDSNCVNCLLAQGANVNIVCSSGRTPLGTAAQLGNMTILKILLDASSTVPAALSENLYKQEQASHHLKHRSKKNRRDYPHTTTAKKHAGACGHNKDNVPSKLLIGASCQENNSDVLRKQFSLEINSDTDSSMADLSNPPNQKQNLGYFIVVHKDRSRRNSMEDENVRRTVDENWNQGMNESANSCAGVQSNENSACALNDVRTPDGMDGLEWDVEVEDKGRNSESEEEEDSWASLYRWYADILDRTSSLLQLPHKCDVNHQDVYGRCAVHYAAEQGHMDALRLLTAAGCRVDIGDSDNLTPLHLAASRDHFKVAKMLLDSGVEVNRKTSDKTSALHIAASRGFVDTVKVLLDAGANVDSLDSSDRTPLMVAVSRCAIVNYPNALTGSMPLHEAVEYIRDSKFSTFESMFNVLKSYGAILSVQTCTGSDTPLFRAMLLEKDRVAALLISRGIDVNLCDVEACVVDNLLLARKRNNFPLARMMIYAGYDLKNCTPDLQPPANPSTLCLDKLRDWLTYMKFNPMRLTELCRLVIRKQLGESVYEKIMPSFLPSTLKKYVLLEDIEVNVYD
ncbi:hypothetical protein C0J52_00531 [Blattella germanica]|nr:hypothetical protein C0J52_00531 [Blattella germanica]